MITRQMPTKAGDDVYVLKEENVLNYYHLLSQQLHCLVFSTTITIDDRTDLHVLDSICT